MKNTQALKYLIAFIKGAGVVLGVLMVIPAIYFGALFLMRALMRILFGTENCTEYSRFCATQPTLYDNLAVYGLGGFVFIFAAIVIGYFYFFKDDAERKSVSKNWPWPD